jgi:hypothetical protein
VIYLLFVFPPSGSSQQSIKLYQFNNLARLAPSSFDNDYNTSDLDYISSGGGGLSDIMYQAPNIHTQIRYHEGFLGQRIGKIQHLNFHKNRLVLAASAADCMVSIFTPK